MTIMQTSAAAQVAVQFDKYTSIPLQFERYPNGKITTVRERWDQILLTNITKRHAWSALLLRIFEYNNSYPKHFIEHVSEGLDKVQYSFTMEILVMLHNTEN